MNPGPALAAVLTPVNFNWAIINDYLCVGQVEGARLCLDQLRSPGSRHYGELLRTLVFEGVIPRWQ